MFSIKNGDKRLLSSCSLIIDSKLETSFEVTDSNETITFHLQFLEKEGKNKFTIDWEVVDSQSMKIILTNWNSVSPIVLDGLQKVGDINNKELFVIFSVSALGSSSTKQVVFSAYTGKEIQNECQ